MNRFLLCTGPRPSLRADAAAAFQALGDSATAEPTELVARPDLVLLGTATAPARTCDDGRGFCHFPSHPPRDWRRGTVVTAADLLAAVRDRGLAALSDLTAPFAVVVQAAAHGPVWVASDEHGLQHVYSCTDGDHVLVSDSCLLLAALAARPLDEHAVLTCQRIGHYLGDESPFRGVTKLRGGTAWQLAAGARTSVPVPAAAAPELDGAACLRACVQAQLAGDDPLVELSGGLDSRLIVAALGDACRGRRAVTLGTPDGADVQVAQRLARDLGFDWQFVDLRGMAELDDADLFALVRRASLRCDHTTQPLARAVLEWVNDRTSSRPRFSGQNGELARGFYYPGFADRTDVAPGTVARLLHWRLSTNDCIDRTLVDDELWRSHEQRLLQRLHDTLAGYGQPWLRATDEFYLRERMQRWVGVAYSAETQHHGIRAPFFDPRFVAWTRSLPPLQKRGSLRMARLVGELSPGLARLPTAGGLSPQQQGSLSPVARLRRRAQFVGKVARKVTQRLRGARRSPVGAPELARRLLASGIAGPAALPHVAELPWIRGAAIAEVLGRGVASWASLGHLLALEWTLQAVARAQSAAAISRRS